MGSQNENAPKRRGSTPNLSLPLGRIKHLMKQDEDIGKIASNANAFMGKVALRFLEELSSKCVEESGRREKGPQKVTLDDLITTIGKDQRLDFLQDIVHGPLAELNDGGRGGVGGGKRRRTARRRRRRGGGGGGAGGGAPARGFVDALLEEEDEEEEKGDGNGNGEGKGPAPGPAAAEGCLLRLQEDEDYDDDL